MNIFYNVCSITIGVFLIVFGILTLVQKKKILFSILTFIHAVLFIGFGILGFPLMDTEYELMTILAMLAFSITYIICILTLYKQEPKPAKEETGTLNPKK